MNKRKTPVRPSKKLFDQICYWVSEGKSLRSYCKTVKGAPDYSTIYGWFDKYPDFDQQFARARKAGHDMIAQECFEIIDEVPPVDMNGRVDNGFVSWQKNRVWTRTQLLAKWDKRYSNNPEESDQGDKFRETIQKVQIEVIGKDDAN